MAAWGGQEARPALYAELPHVRHGHRRVALCAPRTHVGLRLLPLQRDGDDEQRARIATEQRRDPPDQDPALLDQPCPEMLSGGHWASPGKVVLTISICRCTTSAYTSAFTTSPPLNTKTSLESYFTHERCPAFSFSSSHSSFQAFMWTQSGQNEFQNLLSSLRRTKSCKKDLWTKITAAVQSASLPGAAQ